MTLPRACMLASQLLAQTSTPRHKSAARVYYTASYLSASLEIVGSTHTQKICYHKLAVMSADRSAKCTCVVMHKCSDDRCKCLTSNGTPVITPAIVLVIDRHRCAMRRTGTASTVVAHDPDHGVAVALWAAGSIIGCAWCLRNAGAFIAALHLLRPAAWHRTFCCLLLNACHLSGQDKLMSCSTWSANLLKLDLCSRQLW